MKTLVIGAAIVLAATLSSLANAAEPKLSGAFIWPANSLGWSKARWTEEFNTMKSVGMDIVIMSHTVNDTEKKAYFPTTLPGFTAVSTAATDFNNLFTAADENNIEVHLGLLIDEKTWYSWTVDTGDLSYPQALARKSKTTVSDLINLYGKHKSFKGIYLTQELENSRFLTEEKRDVLVKHLLNPIADHTKGLRPDMVVSNAPFFVSALYSVEVYEAWWNAVLAAAPNLDLVIPQDGIGAGHRGLTLKTIPLYFAAAKRACDRHKRVLWSDIELFDKVGHFDPNFDRFLKQLEAEAPYVEKFIGWEWAYVAPYRDAKSRDWFKSYIRYYDGLTTSPASNISK